VAVNSKVVGLAPGPKETSYNIGQLTDLDLDRKLPGGGDDQRLRRLAAAEFCVGVTLQKSVQNPAIRTRMYPVLGHCHRLNRTVSHDVAPDNFIFKCRLVHTLPLRNSTLA
jgi:hypothetical protein